MIYFRAKMFGNKNHGLFVAYTILIILSPFSATSFGGFLMTGEDRKLVW
jgi:hypothetical protein